MIEGENMKAVILTNPETIEISAIPTPSIEANEVLLRVKSVGICGSDIGIYKGLHPRAQFPLTMGHEFSGVIEKVNEGSNLKVGAKATVNPLIYCRECESCLTGNKHVCENLKLIGVDENGGFAEYVKIYEHQVVLLPAEMDFDKAALIEPVAVGIHAVRKSNLKKGDDVLVLGGGPIGVITALCAKISGAKNIYVSEVNSERRKLIEDLGLKALDPMDDFENTVLNLNKRKVDIVFEVAGVAQTIKNAVTLVKNSGQVVIVSVFKKPEMIDFQQINFREINLIGTRVYTDEDFEEAIQFINKIKEFERVITHKYSIDDIHLGFESMLNPGSSLKVIIQV